MKDLLSKYPPNEHFGGPAPPAVLLYEMVTWITSNFFGLKEKLGGSVLIHEKLLFHDCKFIACWNHENSR